MDALEEFKRYRERMNAEILTRGGIGIKRFFTLDDRVYEKGALDVRTKELMGLVASTVLRCNDCIIYHVIRCVQEGVSDAELFEALTVALIVGGSITIPHMRRAVETLDQCREKQRKGESIEVLAHSKRREKKNRASKPKSRTRLNHLKTFGTTNKS